MEMDWLIDWLIEKQGAVPELPLKNEKVTTTRWRNGICTLQTVFDVQMNRSFQEQLGEQKRNNTVIEKKKEHKTWQILKAILLKDTGSYF